jgi:precorrin isomerase
MRQQICLSPVLGEAQTFLLEIVNLELSVIIGTPAGFMFGLSLSKW